MTGRAPESSRALAPGGRVGRVEAGSPAAAAGIAPGDLITALDGRALRDTIDYRFYLEVGGGQLEVERGGRRFSVRVSCDGGDPGIEFESDIFDRVRVCGNKCPFCFVNQLPRGLRKPFYVKDDDFRLSFLYGNFVTLNNLEPGDLDRIIGQRLSPLHVSVHATDPAVRARLMGCDLDMAATGLKNLRLLGEAGIKTHVQVVLCPGVNDGPVLGQIVAELEGEYTDVASVGVVPVALGSGYAQKVSRAGLRPVTAADCMALAPVVTAWQKDFRERHGEGFVYAADEFYLMVGLDLPPVESYDDFPQYGNGIGIAASFLAEGEEEIGRLLGEEGKDGGGHRGRIFLLTGTLAAGVVDEVCCRLSGVTGHSAPAETARFRPLVAENRLFGPHVTVTGLLGGGDIVDAAREAGLTSGDLLLIPPACTAAGSGERFIDGMTLSELSGALDCNITKSGTSLS